MVGSRRLPVLLLAEGPAGGARCCCFLGEGQLCIPWQEWQALCVQFWQLLRVQ